MKYFVEKFPFLLIVKDSENIDVSWDLLQKQFIELQCEDLKFEDKNTDEIIGYIHNIYSVDGNQKYKRKVKVFKDILSITLKNVECKPVFSIIKKNKTQFHS